MSMSGQKPTTKFHPIWEKFNKIQCQTIISTFFEQKNAILKYCIFLTDEDYILAMLCNKSCVQYTDVRFNYAGELVCGAK